MKTEYIIQHGLQNQKVVCWHIHDPHSLGDILSLPVKVNAYTLKNGSTHFDLVFQEKVEPDQISNPSSMNTEKAA